MPDPSTLREPQGRPEQGRGATGSGSPRAQSKGDWHAEIRRRLMTLALRPTREMEIVEEIGQHLEDRYTGLRALGASEEEAVARAWRELDDSDVFGRAISRIESPAPVNLPPAGAPHSGGWLGTLWQDIRYSGRTLRSSPGFSLTVLLAVALSIGPVTAILSVGNWLLWRPHPGVTDARSLGVVWFGQWRQNGVRVGFSPSGVSYDDLADIRSRARSISGIAGVQESSASLSVPGRPATPGRHRRGHGGFLRCPRRPDQRRQELHARRRPRPVRRAGRGDQPRPCAGRIWVCAGRPRQVDRAQQPDILCHRCGPAGVWRHLEHRGHRGLAHRRDLAVSEPRRRTPLRLLPVRRSSDTRQDIRRGRERVEGAGETARRRRRATSVSGLGPDAADAGAHSDHHDHHVGRRRRAPAPRLRQRREPADLSHGARGAPDRYPEGARCVALAIDAAADDGELAALRCRRDPRPRAGRVPQAADRAAALSAGTGQELHGPDGHARARAYRGSRPDDGHAGGARTRMAGDPDPRAGGARPDDGHMEPRPEAARQSGASCSSRSHSRCWSERCCSSRRCATCAPSISVSIRTG